MRVDKYEGKKKKMKKINASLMTVAVVLALIAFVAPISATPPNTAAHTIWGGNVNLENGFTFWTFKVTCEGNPEVSNFMVAWCNRSAVEEVKVECDGVEVTPKPGWDYGEFNKHSIHGIKIDHGFVSGNTIDVTIKLKGDYSSTTIDNVDYEIKAGGIFLTGTVRGPVACRCSDPIPEFSTIAIPIASILGLLFFFNHRKRREK